ncbi:MAG: lipopolysaccharide heptosyltransferase I [Nitrospirales bacterium]|nr:MAG: lipopolysaccharide heptosyltransferase I [Nitrospirales bacterium]
MIPEPKRILLLKPSSLGDIVHALPTLASLRRRYPLARITWLIKEEWAELLEGNPDVDEIIPVNFRLRYWPSLVRRVRQGKYDMVIDLQGLFRTGLLAGLSGASERVGFAAGREASPWFYTQRVKLPLPMDRAWRLLDMHAVDRNLAIARYLGAETDTPTFRLPDIEDDRRSIRQQLDEAGVKMDDRLIALAPLSREDIKNWPLDRYVDLTHKLVQWPNCKVVVLGSSAQHWIMEKFSRVTKEQCIDMVGTLRLRQIGSLMREVDVLIANDSAPVHLAVAVGVPVVGLYGPTHAGATGPYRISVHRSLHTQTALACRPCGQTTCHHAKEKECLTMISVAEVMSAVESILAETSASNTQVTEQHHS